MYQYDQTNGAGPHALTTVNPSSNSLLKGTLESMDYTSFDKIAYLSQSTEENSLQTMTLNYGASEAPIAIGGVKQVYEHNGVRQEKIFVDGIYEKLIENEKDIKEKYYIYTPNGLTAVRITQNNNSSIYYVLKDHIGSVNTLVAANGNVAQETYFDAWGYRRDTRTFEPLTTTFDGIISYGFTGHDHWDSFGLIYMKGRVYDPALGRFLSPDNYVQNAGDLQSYK